MWHFNQALLMRPCQSLQCARQMPEIAGICRRNAAQDWSTEDRLAATLPCSCQSLSQVFNLPGLPLQHCGIRQDLIHNSIVDHPLGTAGEAQRAVGLIRMNHRWREVADDDCLCVATQRRLQDPCQFAVPVRDVTTCAPACWHQVIILGFWE